MRQRISFLVIGFLLGMLGSCLLIGIDNLFSKNNSTNSKLVLKLAHNSDTKHPVHLAVLEFKRLVEEKSAGQMSIDIYSSGVLGDELQCMQQLKNGSLDITKASTAQVNVFVPGISLLAMPYLYSDKAHFWKVLDSDVGTSFLDRMDEYGFVGLCYYDAGSRCFYSSKKKITKVEDLASMKIRVMNSKSDIDMVSAFNASPTPISVGETYTALAQGVVDGAENNLPTYLTSTHYEVAKFFTLDEHTMIPDALLISKHIWKNINEAQKDILMQAAKESSLYQREVWENSEQEAMQTLSEKGVEFLKVNKEGFRAKTSALYEELNAKDKEIIDAIIKLR